MLQQFGHLVFYLFFRLLFFRANSDPPDSLPEKKPKFSSAVEEYRDWVETKFEYAQFLDPSDYGECNENCHICDK